MNKKIAIVTLTWNDWKNTIECLESIFNSSYNFFDVILIDNNSEKFHLDKIFSWSKNKINLEDEEFTFDPNKNLEIINISKSYIIKNTGKKKIFLFRNKENLGLTAGLNVGYEFLLKQDYDYIARIDCDFIISKKYLEDMKDLFEKDNKIVAASPKIKHAYLRDTVWWAGFKMKWSYLKFHKTMNLKKKRIQDDEKFKGLIETDSLCGCCSFYSKNALKLSGLGDEDFFLGPEDIELSYRLKKFGKILVNLNTYTLHKIARSSEISGIFKRSYTDTIGFLLLIRKIGSTMDKLIGYTYFIARIPIFIILKLFKNRDKDMVSGYIRGCKEFFFKKT